MPGAQTSAQRSAAYAAAGSSTGGAAPAVTLPSSGTLFKAAGDFGSSLYYAGADGSISEVNLLDPTYLGGNLPVGAGNQANLAIQKLSSAGINYNSLPTYNIGDLTSAGAKFSSVSAPSFFGSSSVTMQNGSPTFNPGNATGTPTTPSQPMPSSYTTTGGESLGTIAQKYGTNVQTLMAANPNLSPASVFGAGSQINLPGASPIPQNSSNPLNGVASSVYGAVSAVPDQEDSGAVSSAGSSAASSYAASQSQASPFGIYTPIATGIQSAISAIQNPQYVTQSMQEEYNSLSQNTPYGSLPQLNMNVMNLQNVMSGTVDDIRQEVTAGNGFATESMVQAMATARNNTLLRQLTVVQNQAQLAESWVSDNVQFAESDRSNALSEINDITGLEEYQGSLVQQIQTTAQKNYSSIATQENGYQTLAQMFEGDPTQEAMAEQSLGLPAGTLSVSNTTQLQAWDANNAKLQQTEIDYYKAATTAYNDGYNGTPPTLPGSSGVAGGTTATVPNTTTSSGGTQQASPATPGDPSNVVGGIQFGTTNAGLGPYAAGSTTGSIDPTYVGNISKIYTALQGTDLGTYIKNNAPNSTITASMIQSAATANGVDPNILAATLANESNFGTAGAGVKTNDPGNQMKGGADIQYPNMQAGINATAKNLASRLQSGGNGTQAAAQTFSTSQMQQIMNTAMARGTSTNVGPSGTHQIIIGDKTFSMSGQGQWQLQSAPSSSSSSASGSAQQASATPTADPGYASIQKEIDGAQPFSGSALTTRRWSLAANAAISNYINLPIFQTLAGSGQYLAKIEAAQKDPGSVTDIDLLDSYINLSKGSGQVTEAQISGITDGSSIADQASVLSNKLANGGVLSTNQRSALEKLSSQVYQNYQELYAPVYDKAIQNMKSQGIPVNFWGQMPNLDELSDLSDTATEVSSSNNSTP